MPNDQFGVSFMPQSDAENGQLNDVEPLQEAVKLLNLRLPSVVGASSPVHPSLLAATGLQGQPDFQFIRQLLGLGPQMPRTGAPSLGSDFPMLTGPKPHMSQAPQPQPNIIVGTPPNLGGTGNPDMPGGMPGGNVMPWPGGPFTPQPTAPPRPQRGQFSAL